MEKLKANSLERSKLSKNQMGQVQGGAAEGTTCSCSCYYRNVGGSSIADNGKANFAGGLNSVIKTADAALYVSDGKGGCYDFWRDGR